LAEGDALNGEDLLLVDGLVDGEGARLEFGELALIFEMEDRVGLAAEAVRAGVLRGTSFAVGGTGAGGVLRVGSVGGELLLGNGVGHRVNPPCRHEV
jgi:hypothetical protein